MSGVGMARQANWLLLDTADAQQALATLRRGFAGVRCTRLFDGTEFQAVSEHGPRLIDLHECPALLGLCHRDPQTWRGLLLTSQAGEPTLLKHLRRMLSVSFGLNHRALLGYYNRQTASYFFDACDAADLSRWLGPIEVLRWFGGTWADLGIGSQGWQQLRNPQWAVEPLGIDASLTRRQRERLQSCLLEQHIWRWSQSAATDYPTLAAHVQQGLALGFREKTLLDDWLWLRLQHPRAPLPPVPDGLSAAARLARLRQVWQPDQP
ncbi:DUF4123 domain-containing protein [Pseudomonas sp. Eth.TT006]